MGVKQNVPNNANETKSMKFSKLRGVDYSSSPFEVSTSRAVHSKNMINEDGVNHKRKGWTTDSHINFGLVDNTYKNFKILNVFKIGEKYILTVDFGDSLGKRTYIVNDLNSVFDVNNSQFFDIYDSSKIFEFDTNKFLVEDCVIDYNNSENKLSANGIYSSSYVPTTTISINSVEDKIDGAVSYEEKNLLTNRRKNSMIGKNVETVKVTLKTMNTDKYVHYASISDGYALGSNRVEYDMGIDSNRVYNREVSFRVLPGWYIVSAGLDFSGGDYILCDENGNVIGDAPTVNSSNARTMTIEEDTVIYIREG